jgi:hypothetical protein
MQKIVKRGVVKIMLLRCILITPICAQQPPSEPFVGQIIRLPVALVTEYPDTSAALVPASCVLLIGVRWIGVRWWITDFRERDDPLPRLCRAMDVAGAHDAAFSVDQLMAAVVRFVQRPVIIHCPRCPTLSEDEKHLLNAARLVQAGQSQMAERALRTALLSAQGAKFALGPLQGLGELFAEAKLLFHWRQPPAADMTTPADVV